MLRQDVDEPTDDAETHEDVDNGEDLPQRRGRSGVSEADCGKRGDAEVEGVQHAPSLHKGEEGRPAQQEGDHKGKQKAERLVALPSVPDGAQEPTQHHDKADQDYTSERLGRWGSLGPLCGFSSSFMGEAYGTVGEAIFAYCQVSPRGLLCLNFSELRKAEVRLPRIYLPRSSVNKGKEKGRGCSKPRPPNG